VRARGIESGGSLQTGLNSCRDMRMMSFISDIFIFNVSHFILLCIIL
jgi:hypothetical protein